ncbi:phage integrase SAM-like domain-containing protein [Phenylobacterium sp.]|uniref:phage integrase SAM-like domain-containing protein n=1 Tax=Phenylobacterium sp. TaxID=1871053 RepID=UPI00286DB066|nr:hypothetical protein [Phenylobacterium sp.]
MLKSTHKFRAFADRLILDTETEVLLGNRSQTLLRDYRQRNDCYCAPFLWDLPIREIDNRKLKDFVAYLSGKGLKSTSVEAILSFVSMVLKLAADENCIQILPRIPRPRHKDCPRPAFTPGQYKTLIATCKKVEKGNPTVNFKRSVVDAELRWMITFMANAFLRPRDLFTLKHSHVEVVEREGAKFLRLNPPASKRHNGPIITMPAAVDIYRRVTQASAKKGFGRHDDYVFLPDRADRTYAQEIASRQFGQILKIAGLKSDDKGAAFSLYSIRHYAITTRIRNSENLNLLVLARNCRTSVEMIDRFYASSLTAEMQVESLQSFRRPSRYSVEATTGQSG